jgi:hypothetical protein
VPLKRPLLQRDKQCCTQGTLMTKHFREREIKQLGDTFADFIIAFRFPFPNSFQTRANGSGNKSL